MALGKKILGLFVNVEALRQANAEFKNKIAEADANYAEQKRERKHWQKKNREQFNETIAQATNERNAKLGRVARV